MSYVVEDIKAKQTDGKKEEKEAKDPGERTQPEPGRFGTPGQLKSRIMQKTQVNEPSRSLAGLGRLGN